MRLTSLALVAVVLLSVPARAAALTQPNGATIPSAPGCDGGKPTGLAATFACVCDQPGVCNIGATCASAGNCPDGKNAVCETTLSHVWNDNTCIPTSLDGLDPAKDASLVPETFTPSCALTFTLLTRGTAMFHDVFGWYNVTAGKPAASDLHAMLGCTDGPGKVVTLDVKSDPAYKGGEIGFFILTPENGTTKACAGGDCCAALGRYPGAGHLYFSERQYNDDDIGSNPFVHLLVFDSKIAARKFYFAWEDIFGGSNDDFTDLVTSVEGVECAGGGESCDTGLPGRCGRGAKACKDGALACVGVLGPTGEACNGVDDDCNGAIDDDAKCADPHAVCHQGRCVGSCNWGEFPCGPGLECDGASGLCVDTGCKDVTCASGQICRGGACVAPCAGVVCPHGQVCLADACVDPCAGVSCAAGNVCHDGVCLGGCAQCGGLQCGAGTTCDPASGACNDTTCGQPCAAGSYCEAGQCKDACAGAICPQGLTCSQGSCVDPSSIEPQGAGLQGSDGADGENDDAFDRRRAGCACETGPATRSEGLLFAALAFGLVAASGALRRRRRF